MFTSKVRELMDKKKMTVRDMVEKTGMSSRTIQRAVSDDTIHKCELGTLGRIANSMEVPIKKLFDGEYEPDGRG